MRRILAPSRPFATKSSGSPPGRPASCGQGLLGLLAMKPAFRAVWPSRRHARVWPASGGSLRRARRARSRRRRDLEVLAASPELLHDRRRRRQHRRPGRRGRRRRRGCGLGREGRRGRGRDQEAHAAADSLHHRHERRCRITSAATRRCPRRARRCSPAPARSASPATSSAASRRFCRREKVLERMSAPTGQASPFPVGAMPTETFDYARKYMYLNGEGIEVLHQPAAHTDGDVDGVLPPLGRRRGRRHPRHDALPGDRRREGRHDQRRDRRAQSAGRPGDSVGADRLARGRHARDSRARPRLRSVRRRRVPRHGHDRSRPRSGSR